MKQTFKGYLEGILKERSKLNSLSIRRLFNKALGQSDLAAPLFLYAALSDKAYYLMSMAWNTSLEHEYRQVLQALKKYESVEQFAAATQSPGSYKRVYYDFIHLADNKAAADADDLKELSRLRQRSVRALEKVGITRYQLCQTLHLNPGNVYAYLSGDLSKVSVTTARRICDYLYSLSEE